MIKSCKICVHSVPLVARTFLDLMPGKIVCAWGTANEPQPFWIDSGTVMINETSGSDCAAFSPKEGSREGNL